MFVTNKEDGPMLQLKLLNVEPYPFVLHPGHTEEVDDKAMNALAPFAQQFGLKITKKKPKDCKMQEDYVVPEAVTVEDSSLDVDADTLVKDEGTGDQLNEPDKGDDVTGKPLNEPAPKSKKEEKAKGKGRAKIN